MSLSNTDMAVAERIGSIMFPEPSKKAPEAVQEAPQQPRERVRAEPVADETPPASEAENEIESDAGADDGDAELSTEDTGHDPDAGQEPSIKPPSGLTADELEAFQGLSPAAQKAWARRDQDRAKELSRVQTRLAEREKEHATAMQEIQSERQRLAQAATQYGDKAEQDFIAKFGDIKTPQDVIALGANDPARYLEFDSALKALQFASASKQEMQKQLQAEEQEKISKYITERNAELKEHFGDDETFNKFDDTLSKFLLKEGYTQKDIILASAKNLLMADDARKWRQAQAARKTAETQRGDVPPVVRPGAKRDVDAKAASQAALVKKARATGSVDDAAKRIGALI